MINFRHGFVVSLCLWLAFVAMPVVWMLATHDGPETLMECLERVYQQIRAQ